MDAERQEALEAHIDYIDTHGTVAERGAAMIQALEEHGFATTQLIRGTIEVTRPDENGATLYVGYFNAWTNKLQDVYDCLEG